MQVVRAAVAIALVVHSQSIRGQIDPETAVGEDFVRADATPGGVLNEDPVASI